MRDMPKDSHEEVGEKKKKSVKRLSLSSTSDDDNSDASKLADEGSGIRTNAILTEVPLLSLRESPV